MNKNNTKIMALLLAAVLAVSGCAGADSAPAEENGTQEPAEQGAREAAAAAGNTVKDKNRAGRRLIRQNRNRAGRRLIRQNRNRAGRRLIRQNRNRAGRRVI